MISNIIGAFAGYEASQKTPAVDGPGGALLGAIAPMVLQRMGIAGAIGFAIGGYVAARLFEKR